MATIIHGNVATEIEAELSRRGFELRFTPRLEAAYQAVRGAARNRAMARYLVVYLAAKLLFLFCNLQIGSLQFRVSMLLRLGIVLPMTVLAVVLLLRPVASWIQSVTAFAPLIVETALVLLLGRLSGSAFSERYVIAAGVGIFAQTLLMPAPFRYCIRALVVALTVFCSLSLISWPSHFGPRVSGDYLVFVIGLSLPALYERHCRERSSRRDFLLNEINRMRLDDIMRMNAHLERLSCLDALTGIFNRRYLDSALIRLCDIAAEKERWISILMIDIDHFKKLNDTSGHQHGDFCLERVAQILQHSVRAGVDTVARYGGEEFCAILPDADPQLAMMIGERVRKCIEDAGLAAANGTVVTVSAGAGTICGGVSSRFAPQDLLAVADQALYQAKRAGRNRVISSVLALQEPRHPHELAVAQRG